MCTRCDYYILFYLYTCNFYNYLLNKEACKNHIEKTSFFPT